MRDARSRVVVAVLVTLAGLSGVVAPVAAGSGDGAVRGASPEGGQAQLRPVPLAQAAVDPDVVVMRADVGAGGDANWSVELRVRLDDDNATAAFDSLQADVESNATAFTSQFATGMRRTVRSAENATNRQMSLENVTVSAGRERFGQEYGVLTYRFTWHRFAAVDGDRIRAGDALSGFFLDSETSLVVAWPDGYARESVTPGPDESTDTSVTWHGRAAFGPEEPRVVVADSGSAPLPTATLVAVGFALLAAVAGGLVALRRRDERADSPAGAGGAAGEPAGEAAASGSAGAGAENGAGAQAGTAPADVRDGPPEELLSNEERVLKLLEENGGRVKQQRIAEAYDWTDAKTSQVVGDLRENDEVETFRIGRENVVTLPEESDL